MEGLDDTAETLEDGFANERGTVSLTLSDGRILGALQYCPYGLSELRAVLRLEDEWRQGARPR